MKALWRNGWVTYKQTAKDVFLHHKWFKHFPEVLRGCVNVFWSVLPHCQFLYWSLLPHAHLLHSALHVMNSVTNGGDQMSQLVELPLMLVRLCWQLPKVFILGSLFLRASLRSTPGAPWYTPLSLCHGLCNHDCTQVCKRLRHINQMTCEVLLDMLVNYSSQSLPEIEKKKKPLNADYPIWSNEHRDAYFIFRFLGAAFLQVNTASYTLTPHRPKLL